MIGTPSDGSAQTLSSEKKPGRRKRSFAGPVKYVVTALTVLLAIFHLYTAFFGLFPSMQQRSFHIAFVLALIFLLYPATSRSPMERPSPLDWICAGLGAFCSLYVFFNYDAIASRAGMYLDYEIYLGIVFTALVFEAARRTLGNVMPVFCSLFLLFAYFGRSLPGPLRHFGLSIPRIVEELYLTTDGLFGLVAGVSATYIFLFILFGAFLDSTKTSTFFNDFSMALTGHMKGGPARIAVLASALMGTISGSTSANVATTGAFTIPLMKRVGFQPHYAGAVEAAASTGGQIMPPVMGAAAFIIADTLGVPYMKVLLAAIVPALLYFWGIWCALGIEADKMGIKGLDRSQLPRLRDVLFRDGYKAIPLAVIIYFLLRGYNPLYAACWGIGAAVVFSYVRKESRLDLKGLVATLEAGSKTALSVAIACTIVGVVIGMMGATGVALKIGDVVLAVTQGRFFPTLVVTMILGVIFGMGMPTTASYVMTSAVAAPALVLLGSKPLDVHMFVFYFAALSSITPPVCVGAYTAAGIAGSDPNKTAFTSVKLALTGFLIPFIFMYSPEILLTNVASPWLTGLAVLSAFAGVYVLAVATEGYLFFPLLFVERLCCFAAALFLLMPGSTTDVVGLALFGGIFMFQKWRARKGGDSGRT